MIVALAVIVTNDRQLGVGLGVGRHGPTNANDLGIGTEVWSSGPLCFWVRQIIELVSDSLKGRWDWL